MQATLNERLVELQLFRLRLPLTAPYHLAYGDVEAFDTILVYLRTTDGAEGWGETTPLEGYSTHGAEDAWRLTVEWGRVLRGQRAGDALAFLDARTAGAPFACAGLATALETAAWGEGDTGGDAAARVPLIGTIRSAEPAEISDEVERLLGAGYSTLKLKIGRDVAADLANVSAAQHAARRRGLLRIDANQGYTLADARRLFRGLDPAGIQLLEQPFPVDRWDWMEVAGKDTPVPLMLDESIGGEEDLRRASGILNVRYVKFKLMKAGSIARLEHLVAHAAALGLGVVVGNGVASDIGCLHEAQAVAGRLALAGEMNGFLKLTEPLVAAPLRVDRGDLIVPPRGQATVLRERVAKYAIASARL